MVYLTREKFLAREEFASARGEFPLLLAGEGQQKRSERNFLLKIQKLIRMKLKIYPPPPPARSKKKRKRGRKWTKCYNSWLGNASTCKLLQFG